MKRKQRVLFAGLLGLALMLPWGCGSSEEGGNVREELRRKRADMERLEKEIRELERQLSETPGQDESAGIPVAVESLELRPFSHFILVNGTVEAVRQAYISPELNGQINRIHVREGDVVNPGDLLVSLNSAVIESSIAEARTQLDLARTIYAKRKGLWDKKIGSEVQYLEARNRKESLENKLETLQAQLDMTRIRAPIGGIVDTIALKEGELAAPGQLLIQLVCLDELSISADVSEAYLSKVNKGDPVTVTFPTFPDWEINTRVHRTGNIINPQNRTFEVELRLRNDGQRLKPNMLALLELRDFQASRAMVVPSILVKNDRQGAYVYVVDRGRERPVARKVYVTPGMTQGSETMIVSGLSPGDELVVQGYNLVKNGTPVHVTAPVPLEGES
ncbi:MAG: efflux RND transporter periplasmic adaptor subunit [Acidobacteriota bacterium]|jgi:RND family efflux transporter MFP subunit|nr:efflux RND transporter periplasmic adaptor subunit [Acidobacteriota bacterium]